MARGDAADEAVFLDAARVLLSAVRYHGLFGCEWLKERSSGEIFVLDFNPRSVYGNSHLLAAGVNLPYLAYRDLCGEDLSDVPERPPVRRLYWADWWGCAGAWWRLRGSRRLGLGALLRALLRPLAHAVWSAPDPLPALGYAWMQLGGLWRSGRDRGASPQPSARLLETDAGERRRAGAHQDATRSHRRLDRIPLTQLSTRNR